MAEHAVVFGPAPDAVQQEANGGAGDQESRDGHHHGQQPIEYGDAEQGSLGEQGYQAVIHEQWVSWVTGLI